MEGEIDWKRIIGALFLSLLGLIATLRLEPKARMQGFAPCFFLCLIWAIGTDPCLFLHWWWLHGLERGKITWWIILQTVEGLQEAPKVLIKAYSSSSKLTFRVARACGAVAPHIFVISDGNPPYPRENVSPSTLHFVSFDQSPSFSCSMRWRRLFSAGNGVIWL